MRLHTFIEGIEISSALYGMVQRIEAAANTVQKTLATWVSRVHDRRQLAVMSDHMLDDIGVSRIEVMFETNKYFWQR
jgi:uncharacterized protein YjiS (DUF1127 family)